MDFLHLQLCTVCQDKKPPTEFYKNPKRTDSWCKACRKQARRSRYNPKLSESLRNFSKFYNLAAFVEMERLDMINSRIEEILSHGR